LFFLESNLIDINKVELKLDSVFYIHPLHVAIRNYDKKTFDLILN